MILPNGNLLFAGSSGPVELTRSGAIVRAYAIPGVTSWRGLSLGRDGSTVWIAGFASDWRLYEIDLLTGAVRRTLLLPQTLTTGVAIVGGWRASANLTVPIDTLTDGAAAMLIVIISVVAVLALKR